MLHKEFNNGLRAYSIHQAVQPMGSTAVIMSVQVHSPISFLQVEAECFRG